MREIIKNNFNSICCSQWKCERQNLFFYCYHYKLYFCEKCHINHKNSITNINTISIDNLDSNCELHNDKIIAYYEENEKLKNLCLKCFNVLNMVENKKKSIHDLKLLTNEEIKKINKKFEQEETLIKIMMKK